MPMPPRPTALMIPMVAVWRRPNGAPSASTTSPARALSLSANVIAGRFFSSIFNSATSVPGSAPIFFALFAKLGAQPHHDFVGFRNDVVSGENIAICADDDARPETFERLLALPLRKLLPEKFT